ncbi:DNA-binding NarL/FixJ family response regulator [Mycetocola sp. BIGb0189]|uniref:response regulator transcription factor n=1 Tax=Mycetocola sp. BIGb0189 TaxID=2940604 RepID=UPI002167D36B|nr:response regulator transcription factor [Mycetocola sp. BIGb0189]MCS4276805.1 DNA-binding NarL/FixJ family response regulator [Mycetocola sp. BIGb0189]
MSAVRIAVIDDHESVRLGLQAVCAAAGHRIVSSTAGVAEFLEIRVPVDVVVLDLSLGDGSSVAENVRAVSRDGAAVLIHSIADRVGLVREALAAGAAGVIPKSSPAHDVVAAIETVAGGGPLTNLEWASAIEADRQFAVAQLGPRERDVLSLYASGLPLKDVAVELGIAPSTVKEYLNRIRGKYVEVGRPARTKLELLRRAVEDGILEDIPGGPGDPIG